MIDYSKLHAAMNGTSRQRNRIKDDTNVTVNVEGDDTAPVDVTTEQDSDLESADSEVLDSIARAAKLRTELIADSRHVNDSRRRARRIKDSYKKLVKKLKDDLEETESTDAAIDAALANVTEDTPAEDVLAAVIEVLGETIDKLSEDEAPADDVPADDTLEGDALDEAIEDARKRLIDLRARRIKLRDSKK